MKPARSCFDIAVDSLRNLRGVSLHAQAAVLDQGPVLGTTLTNWLQLTVGD